MAWKTPVYNRLLTDVTTPTSKGYFNVADWTRIYDNTIAIHGLTETVKGVSIAFTVINYPTITSFPSYVDFDLLLITIEATRIASGLPLSLGLVVLKTDWLGGANMVSPDYEDVNDWERNIWYIREYMRFVGNDLIYCGAGSGTLIAGQSRTWQHRWRHSLWVPDAASWTRMSRPGLAICGTDLTRQNSFRRY